MKKGIIILFAFMVSLLVNMNAQEYSDALVRKANAGNAKAQNDLGVCYQYGYGVDSNEMEAAKWYKKSASQNNPEGLFNYGCILFDGYFDYDAQESHKNCKDGVNYLLQAKRAGHKQAEEVLERVCNLGYSYWGAKNSDFNVSFYKETPANDIDLLFNNIDKLKSSPNNPSSQFYLGIIEEYSENYTQAFEHFMKAHDILYADDGETKFYGTKDPITGEEVDFAIEAYVQDRLGYYYENGIGVAKNLTKALEFWKESFSRDAFYVFQSPSYLHRTHEAMCYEKLGDLKQYIATLEEHKYTSNGWGYGGELRLSLWLADAYFKGYGVTKDYTKAYKIFEEITECDCGGMGHAYEWYPDVYADACYRIHQMYKDGYGVTKNAKDAQLYFDEALKYGSTSALYDYYHSQK